MPRHKHDNSNEMDGATDDDAADPMPDPMDATSEEALAFGRMLASIDRQVRAVEGGPPGAGLYALLELAGVQFLGMQRGSKHAPGHGPLPPPAAP